MTSYQRSSSHYHDGFKNALEKLTQLDLITQRYDNLLIALPTLKKHQRRNIDGSIINISDPEHGDRWTSLENELHQCIRELHNMTMKKLRNIAKVGSPGLKIK